MIPNYGHQHSLLCQLYDGVSIHEELVMVTPLLNHGGVLVDEVDDAGGREL